MHPLLANGLFYQTGNTPTAGYGEMLRALNSDVREINFRGYSATDDINTWVNDHTKGKIPKLFSEPIDANTVAIILSSLYFKASWASPFAIVTKSRWESYCWRTSYGCNDEIQFMKVDYQYFPSTWVGCNNLWKNLDPQKKFGKKYVQNFTNI